MCGISGVFHYRNGDREVDRVELAKMNTLLEHRGPDDSGIWCDRSIGLAHRRLSIIDIDNGKQPMISDETGHVISYNGEIYNFLDLMEELKKQGRAFRTKCDTEVILALYDRFGHNLLDKINGQFAISIWNRKANELFIARDRLGIKPVYYFDNGKSFYWASEIKALLAVNEISTKLNSSKLQEYFTFRSIMGEETLFRDITELEPGHYLRVVKGKGIVKRRYWSIPHSEKEPEYIADDCICSIREKLIQAVKERLISDVPLGTMNSGGLDSSIISSITIGETQKLNTYSIGFNESQFDESQYAEIVSKAIGSDHHLIRMTPEVYVEELKESIYFNDEPLHLFNAVPIKMISRLASEKVKILLSGEGADEVFAGYGRYKIFPDAVAMSKNISPQKAAEILFREANELSRSEQYKLELIKNHANNLIVIAGSFYGKDLCKEILHIDSDEFENRRSILDGINGSVVSKMLFYDQKVYLPAILQRQDRMCMASGIESRVPFIDYQFLSYANLKVPNSLKINGIEKYILRKAFSKELPNRIVNRGKLGFPVPIKGWFKNQTQLGGLMDVLLASNLRCGAILKKDKLRKMIERFRSNKLSPQEEEVTSDFLFSLVNLELWMNCFSISA